MSNLRKKVAAIAVQEYSDELRRVRDVRRKREGVEGEKWRKMRCRRKCGFLIRKAFEYLRSGTTTIARHAQG